MRPLRTLCLASLIALPLSLSRPAPARAEVLERVVAVLNEDAIFLSDVMRRARPFLAEAQAIRNPAEREAQRQRTVRRVLDRMIDDNLLRAAATRNHITINDAQVDEVIERIAEQNHVTVEQLYGALTAEGLTRAEYRENIESDVLSLNVMQQRVRGRINITDADLHAEYDRRVREMATVSIPRVSQVLLNIPEDATPEQVTAIRARAEEVARRARAGEDFAELARRFSEHEESRESGGDLGAITPEALPTELGEVIEGLAVGATSDPVRGPSGFHVFRVTARQARQPPAFEAVREQLMNIVRNREMERHRAIYLRELRAAASLHDMLDPRRTDAAATPAAPPAAP